MAVQPGYWGIDIGQCALKALRLELVGGVPTATAVPARAAASQPIAIGVSSNGTSYVGFAAGGALARINADGKRLAPLVLDQAGPVTAISVGAIAATAQQVRSSMIGVLNAGVQSLQAENQRKLTDMSNTKKALRYE